tara:strand:- start:2145 stop:2912 length:768 start_codon:yes stop_codon:yes gene_type:complete
LKKKFTILGCGSSLGSPWITNYKGNLKKNPKNIRSRCCAHIQYGDISISIDTSPDIKSQFLKNKIKSLDAIIYTHEHADQTAGIFEMRPFFWKNKKKIPVFGSTRTINALRKAHTYCFYEKYGYKPIMKAKIINNKFYIKKKRQILSIKSFDIIHGMINATGYLFEKVAYLSDCNKIPKKSLKYLYNLDYLILDCLKFKKHPSHFNYDNAINLIKIVNPKKTILTNLHTDIDYDILRKRLPKGIVPAYDGLSFNF